jgi:DNA-binding protein YbaB
MSVIDKILGKTKEAEKVIESGKTFKLVSAYDPVFRDWRGQIYESMLVRAAIDARSRHVSKLKVEFIGSAKPDLSARLAKRPNPWDSWSQFLYRVNTILDATNNCLLVPIYDDGLNKIGFYPVLVNAVKVVEYKGELWLKYKYRNGTRTAACRMIEAALLRKFQFRNDFFGETNGTLDETMDLISIQKQGIKEAIKSTNSYKFMATSSNFALQADLEKDQLNFSERNFSKEAKGGKVLLFPNTYKDIKQIDIKPYTPDKDQMDLIEQNVYDYFGVNKDILQNKAVGDSWTAFYEGAVEPFAIQFSETMTSALYSEREIAFGAEVACTTNRVQYMSFTDKKAYVEGGLDRGILTINEAREVYNLPPLPPEQGDRFVARGEYYFIQEENPKEGENND